MNEYIDAIKNKYGENIINNKYKKPKILAINNAKIAIDMLFGHIKNGDKCLVHTDVDCDGVGTAYIFREFCRQFGYTNCLKFSINGEKIHGVHENHIEPFNKYGAKLIVILDSSSKEIETIKKFNCDVIVIDHHKVDSKEMTGKTAGGQYIIVNNMVDGRANQFDEATVQRVGLEDFEADENMSCGVLLYEIIRLCYAVSGQSEETLDKYKLYQWAALTLYTDEILINNERNLWYAGRTINTEERELGLDFFVKELNKLDGKITKSFINFTFAPIVNSAIRAGNTAQTLKTVMNNPWEIGNLTKFREVQKQKVEAAMNFIDERDSYVICDITNSNIEKAYCGAIAARICGNTHKNCVCYKFIDELARGSFRGRTNAKYNEYFNSFGNLYAEGHEPAFGIRVEPERLEKIMSGAASVEKKDNSKAAMFEVGANTGRGEIFIKDLDDFKRQGALLAVSMINSVLSNKESIYIIANLADAKFIKCNSAKTYYTYDILGLECKSFEELNTGFIMIYAEYVKFVNLFARNIYL